MTRRESIAAEVQVMLRDLADMAVAAAIGGRVGDRERAERVRDEVSALLAAGREGDAHSVASAALYPTEPRAQVAAVREVRS